MTTVNGPVVIAVVVDGAFAVEEKTVLASFQGQGAIGAQEEGIAVLGMGVGENSIWIGTAGGIAQYCSLGCVMVKGNFNLCFLSH